MENFVIEKLSESDVQAVFEIEKKLLSETSIEKIEDTISSKTLSYFVLKNDGLVVGFFECLIVPPEAELYDIAIDTNFQKRGLSKLLMEYLISYAKDCGCETIFLEVNSINKTAISLYEKYGFESYGIRKNYYGENDAVLMKLRLN